MNCLSSNADEQMFFKENSNLILFHISAGILSSVPHQSAIRRIRPFDLSPQSSLRNNDIKEEKDDGFGHFIFCFVFLRKKIFTKLIDLCFDEVVLFEPNENYNQQIKRKKP